MRVRVLLLSVGLPVLLAGVAGCGPLQALLPAPAPAPSPAPVPLELRLAADLRGQTIVLRLTATNRGRVPVDVTLTGRPAYDIVVATAAGRVVWRSSFGQVIQDIIQIRTLWPGQALQFQAEWRRRGNDGRPVAAGRYRAYGVVRTEGGELKSAAITVTVTR